MATIHTPVKGFSGVVAGVSFVAGVGESSDSSALAYFERQGYTVTVEDAPKRAPRKQSE